jgi:phosphate starvation-inducible PhoH-like protein
MKMFLTRLGDNSCMMITGDPSQIDLPVGQSSGLVEAMNILKNVKNIKKIEFSAADVVRHHLVQKIVEAYEKAAGDKGKVQN